MKENIFNLGPYEETFQKGLARLEKENFSTLLWAKDPGLWKKDYQSQETICNSLGWLHMAEEMKEHLNDLFAFVSEVWGSGFRHAVHMGMGGSSLAPIVFQRTFLHTTDVHPWRKREGRVLLVVF